jgi:hypothetical protein
MQDQTADEQSGDDDKGIEEKFRKAHKLEIRINQLFDITKINQQD